MRALKAVAGFVAIFMSSLAVSAPAYADGVSISIESVTYVPKITTVFWAKVQPLAITTDHDVEIHISTTVPGGVNVRSALSTTQSPCTSIGGGVEECKIQASTQPSHFDLAYDVWAINEALGTKSSMTYSTTVSVVGGDSKTVSFYMRPSADLDASASMHVIGLTGSEFALEFNVFNRGPSGSPMITATVTGFRSRPAKGLPSACAWSGSLTVVCTYHSKVSEDVSTSVRVPVVASQRGCSYTVKLVGSVHDPKPSNNSHTAHSISMPCDDPAGDPSATPKPGVGTITKPKPGAGVTATPSAAVTQASDAAASPPEMSSDAASGPSAALTAAVRSDDSRGALGVFSVIGGVLIIAGLTAGFLFTRRRAGVSANNGHG